MTKKQIDFKEVFQYIVKYVLPFILSVSILIPAITTNVNNYIKNSMEEELGFFRGWVLVEFEYDLIKQMDKIENDRDDLKITDLEKLIVLYSTFSPKMQTPGFNEKMVYIKDIYRQLRNKSTAL